ncbi:MAG: hypothetical protein RLZZ598_1735 [Pseudomonadota bacterium]|jgi:hypothetical protein
MKLNLLLASLFVAAGSVSAYAQTTTAGTVQRDVNQQSRIENGLKDGSLSVKEAGHLEKEQARVDHLQAKDLKDGKLDPAERAQLQKAQNKASRDIQAARTNDIKGNPESKSSERMQANVQRNVNQEQRIEQGVASGALTNRETAKLERGQAHVDRREAAAAKDGHISAGEQTAIQNKEDHQSKRIHAKKHNDVTRK